MSVWSVIKKSHCEYGLTIPTWVAWNHRFSINFYCSTSNNVHVPHRKPTVPCLVSTSLWSYVLSVWLVNLAVVAQSSFFWKINMKKLNRIKYIDFVAYFITVKRQDHAVWERLQQAMVWNPLVDIGSRPLRRINPFLLNKFMFQSNKIEIKSQIMTYLCVLLRKWLLQTTVRCRLIEDQWILAEVLRPFSILAPSKPTNGKCGDNYHLQTVNVNWLQNSKSFYWRNTRDSNVRDRLVDESLVESSEDITRQNRNNCVDIWRTELI